MDNVVRHISGTLYLNADHRQRMNTLQKRLGYKDNKFLAAAYLLTATHDIYTRTEHCFCKQSIVFENVQAKDIDILGYTLLKAAQDIYRGEAHLFFCDLSSREIVDTLAFTLLFNALLVARYGSAVLGGK